MTHRMLALDCDGTLADRDSRVCPEVVQAVQAAEAAGLRVCIATGRSFIETLPIWEQLNLKGPRHEPLVCIGGALVSEVPSGRTLYHQPIERHLAAAFSQVLAATGRSAMAFVDGWRHDVDYYLTDVGNVDEILERWFSQMDVRVRRVSDFGASPDMPEPLRISAVVDPAEGRQLERRLRQQFDGQLNLHMIFAPNYDVTIVEAFAAGVDKLSGVRYVAQSWRIPMSQVIAVGDDVNDLPLLTGAGLGVAMPDAPNEVKQAADRVAADGLAKLIHDLVDESAA